MKEFKEEEVRTLMNKKESSLDEVTSEMTGGGDYVIERLKVNFLFCFLGV